VVSGEIQKTERVSSGETQTTERVISKETHTTETLVSIEAQTELSNPTTTTEINTRPVVKRSNFLYLIISIVIITLDQITKYMIRANLEYGEILRITPKFIWITYVKNTGAAFSFSFGSVELNKVIFISVSIIASIMLVYLIKKTTSKLELISYSLILGGAVGNLIDRIFIGGVTDFIWCDFPDFIMRRWPVFNVADSSIVVAITLMIIFTLFFNKQPSEDK